MMFEKLIKDRQRLNYGTEKKAKEEGEAYARRILPRTEKSDPECEKKEDPEMKTERILGRARPSYVVSLIEKGDELTEEDKEIISEVCQHIEEEIREEVEEEKADKLVCTLSKCFIPGCVVHTLIPGCIHYSIENRGTFPPVSSMDERMRKGYEVWKDHPDCVYTEIYERHICVVSGNGTTMVINE
ncbi:MAG: hypothetical protein K6F53_04840 [Lachnospiraceae bacterium]|nr:hypothetical protein [Lachnospiraceae bacterium]